MSNEFKNVKEIVAQYLLAKGYDGLYSEVGECGCSVDNLMPCDSPCDICEPAIERYCPCCGESVFIPFRRILEMCQKQDETAKLSLHDLFGILADKKPTLLPPDSKDMSDLDRTRKALSDAGCVWTEDNGAIATVFLPKHPECKRCTYQQKVLEVAADMRNVGASSMTPHELFCYWAHELEKVAKR